MRWWLGVLLILLGGSCDRAAESPQRRQGKPAASSAASPAAAPAAPTSSAGPAQPGPVLQEPGDVPPEGPGTFVYGTVTGPVLGTAGRLKRFRVAAEANLASELDRLGATAEAALGDPRSWIGGKQQRFQRVASGQPHDLTIYLVTRQTAYQMCRANGVDIRVDGIPYTSCRQIRKVVINLDRWRLSVPAYVGEAVPLETYRHYVINHEVGHELGRGHEACPGPGVPAPVMQTQTLGLNGCVANPWPYLEGKPHSGPPAR